MASKEKIEQTGVYLLSRRISKSAHLVPHFSENDKTKGYDGLVSVVSKDSDKIEDIIGNVYVQIKTRTMTLNPSKKKIKYSIKRTTLEYYYREQPLIFFVIYVEKDSDDHLIYAKNLRKTDLFKILKSREDKNPISFELDIFPENAHQVDDLFLNFLKEKQLQDKMDAENQISFAKARDFSTLSMRDSTFHLEDYNFVDRLRSGKVSLYSSKNNIIYLINPDSFSFVSAKIKVPCNLMVKEESLFEKVEIESFGDGKYKLNFGRSIHFLINEKSDRIDISYSFSDSLRDVVKAMRFLTALRENRVCNLVFLNDSLKCSFGSELPPDKNFTFCKKMLPIYEKAKCLIDLLMVEQDINLSTIKSNELEHSGLIYDSITKGTAVTFKDKNDPFLLIEAHIGNISLALLAERNDYGSYKILDGLNQHNRFKLLRKDSNGTFLVPIESCFAGTYIWKCSNFKESVYLTEMRQLIEKDHNTILVANDNDLLNIIRAYDESGIKALLDCGLKLCQLIEKYNDSILDKRIVLLNRLQIVKRCRTLNEEERGRLIDLLSNVQDSLMKTAILLLLDRKENAISCFEQLESNDKQNFLTFPISIFFRSELTNNV